MDAESLKHHMAAMFEPHPNLTPEVNAAIMDSELQGGADLRRLEVGRKLIVKTKNTTYTIERRADGDYISGNAKYCPEPTLCYIAGSTFGGSMLKVGFVGRGMYMEMQIEGKPGLVTTSQIQEVTEL